jgi:TatD DNase family protein
VCGVVIPAVGPDRWEPLLDWPRRDARVQVGLGIHPQLLPDLPEAEDEAHLARLDALLGQGVACAVGECGLDGPSQQGAPLPRQLRVLRGHFELARKHQLPVLLHCFRLHPALVELLGEVPIPEAGVLLHSYSGGLDLARFYAARGCHFSFAGPVTFPEARKPLAALRVVPRDRLLLETDAPDQAPHPRRGERNEPGWLPLVAQAAARALEVPVETLARETTKTARRLFRRPFGAETG